MKDHKPLSIYVFSLLILFFLLSCIKKEAISYERPAFTLNNTLKDEYLGLYFLNKKMGYFHGAAYEVNLADKKGYYVSGDAVIKIVAENENIYTILKEEILLDENFKTLYFNYSQKIGDSHLNITARKHHNQYALKTLTTGKPEEAIINEDFLPLAAAGFIVWKNGISEGKEYTFNVFVEAMQKTERLIIKIGERTIENGNVIYPLHQKLGNIEITSYILENGDTYKEESIQGFTMKKLSKKEALSFDEKSPTFYDLFSFSLIPVDTDLSKDFTELILLISNFDSKAKIPNSDYQTVEETKNGYKVFLKSKPVTRSKPSINLSPYLSKTMKIQSDAPQIKELARAITKDAKNDNEKAKLIMEWVHKNVKKRLKDKTSALDVLSSKEGECEAHSMLSAALLRSVGIPAKVVGGIVYSKEYKGFLYHAWNEIWVDDHFMPIDATFGEFPAKPYHLKLTEENNMEDVIFYLGKLKIKVLEVK